MEMLKSKIKEFLSVSYGSGYGDGDGSGYGYGYGDGDGSGYGYGYGDGSGYGDGDGSGDGDGYGYGYGDGSGYGVLKYNNNQVYMIDDVQTIITSVRGNVAKGFILNADLTLSPCYVVKGNDLFAHGATLNKALEALDGKLFEDMPVSDRIAAFVSEMRHSERYDAKLLFQWHHKLTGSCEMGALSFCRDKGIDLDKDTFTVKEFINLTKASYRGDIIVELEKSYGNR